ncbi:unnamed protein product [Phytophthora fragariaefolia]|uniref:Unnamed protein product n=1 Tax=Phytophthora fragariaefolia TaxID=1490495 RepID=A0A9W7CPT3_9STRA|nr:unnamed protein product [Phytophthora fragariaefolia]
MLTRVLLIFTLAISVGSYCTQAQDDGIITFWGDKDFKGEKWQFHRTLEPQYCYNDNVGKPSSITWKNQITTGDFNGKSKIGFFTEHDCTGAVLTWFTTKDGFPRDLEMDSINNQIKSFMLLQTSLFPDVIVRDAA